jgi:large subunit ribosomal protein L9
MEVILKENYPSLGYVGDLVKVRPGFARNFLIPRGVAVEASSRNKKLLNHKLAGVRAQKARLKAEAEIVAQQLAPIALEFKLKIGENGKFFGSIAARDIEAALKEKGFTILKTQIRLTEALKRPGDFTASVKLHAEVTVSVPVKIVADVPKKAAAEEGAEGKAKKKGRGKKAAAPEQEADAQAAEAPSKEA